MLKVVTAVQGLQSATYCCKNLQRLTVNLEHTYLFLFTKCVKKPELLLLRKLYIKCK